MQKGVIGQVGQNQSEKLLHMKDLLEKIMEPFEEEGTLSKLIKYLVVLKSQSNCPLKQPSDLIILSSIYFTYITKRVITGSSNGLLLSISTNFFKNLVCFLPDLPI